MAVGDACTVGQRAKKNGYWYECVATNVWKIVQPTCTECTKFTGGTLNNGGYSFTTVSPPNGAKIAGDYPASGERFCWVYSTTIGAWQKKSNADCGDETSDGAWYGCTVTSCIAQGNTCTLTSECCDVGSYPTGYIICEEMLGGKKCTTCQDCVALWEGEGCSPNGAYRCNNTLRCIVGTWQSVGTCPEPL